MSRKEHWQIFFFFFFLGGGGGVGVGQWASSPTFFSDFLEFFFSRYCAITPRMFMCCEYGARLLSHQYFFRPPLSEFSGSVPEKELKVNKLLPKGGQGKLEFTFLTCR